MSTSPSPHVDVILVGTGIMSATLATLLKELQPDWTIDIFESLDGVAAESSDAWNNAGTGHAALCELNYTPQRADGSIDCSKAFHINECFEISKQFWSHLATQGRIGAPASFINPIPHLSFVRGADDVAFLRKRHQALSAHHLFGTMEYTEDRKKLAEWMPIVMEQRPDREPVAATRVAGGSDVNFGALTRSLIASVRAREGVALHLQHEVVDLRHARGTRAADSRWRVVVRDKVSGARRTVGAKFVFLGAGGGALPLLQKSGIPEGKGFGGFPVSGQWLRCQNPELIERHHAKVYGKASVGAPPMSVPHLDTRIIDGKKALLFGPYAGFSTKFLKNGSLLDMPLSMKPDNFVTMIGAGLNNVDLTRYLIGQILQSPKERLAALREFLPTARAQDWRLESAGQRVQVLKKDAKYGGVLQFGTEVICAGDGSLAALLGASPGASTSVSIMLDLIGECFKDRIATPEWRAQLKRMIPSHGESLADDKPLYDRIRSWTGEVLGLTEAAAVR